MFHFNRFTHFINSDKNIKFVCGCNEIICAKLLLRKWILILKYSVSKLIVLKSLFEIGAMERRKKNTYFHRFACDTLSWLDILLYKIISAIDCKTRITATNLSAVEPVNMVNAFWFFAFRKSSSPKIAIVCLTTSGKSTWSTHQPVNNTDI